MNENRKKELEEQLKKMINNSDEVKQKKETRKARTGTGNVIRRRAGQKDVRFSASGS